MLRCVCILFIALNSFVSSNDWTMHTWSDGRTYYYNQKTGASQWDKPVSIEGTSDATTPPPVISSSSRRRHIERPHAKGILKNLSNKTSTSPSQDPVQSSEGNQTHPLPTHSNDLISNGSSEIEAIKSNEEVSHIDSAQSTESEVNSVDDAIDHSNSQTIDEVLTSPHSLESEEHIESLHRSESGIDKTTSSPVTPQDHTSSDANNNIASNDSDQIRQTSNNSDDHTPTASTILNNHPESDSIPASTTYATTPSVIADEHEATHHTDSRHRLHRHDRQKPQQQQSLQLPSQQQFHENEITSHLKNSEVLLNSYTDMSRSIDPNQSVNVPTTTSELPTESTTPSSTNDAHTNNKEQQQPQSVHHSPRQRPHDKEKTELKTKLNALVRKYRVVLNHLSKSEKSRQKLLKQLRSASSNSSSSSGSGSSKSSRNKPQLQQSKQDQGIEEGSATTTNDTTESDSVMNAEHIRNDYESTEEPIKLVDSLVAEEENSVIIPTQGSVVSDNDVSPIIEVDSDNKEDGVSPPIQQQSSSSQSHSPQLQQSSHPSQQQLNQLQHRLVLQENELIDAYTEIETMKLDLKNLAISSLKRLKEKSLISRIFDLFQLGFLNKKSSDKGSGRYGHGSKSKSKASIKGSKHSKRSAGIDKNSDSDVNDNKDDQYSSKLREKALSLAIDTTLTSYTQLDHAYTVLQHNHTQLLDELCVKKDIINDLMEKLKNQEEEKEELIAQAVAKEIENLKLMQQSSLSLVEEGKEVESITVKKLVKSNILKEKSDDDEEEEDEDEEDDEEEESGDETATTVIASPKLSDATITAVVPSTSLLFNGIHQLAESDVQELIDIISYSEDRTGVFLDQLQLLQQQMVILEKLPLTLTRAYQYIQDLLFYIHGTHYTVTSSSSSGNNIDGTASSSSPPHLHMILSNLIWVALLNQVVQNYATATYQYLELEEKNKSENVMLTWQLQDSRLMLDQLIQSKQELMAEYEANKEKLVMLQIQQQQVEQQLPHPAYSQQQQPIASPIQMIGPSSSLQQNQQPQQPQEETPLVIPLVYHTNSSNNSSSGSKVIGFVKHLFGSVFKCVFKIFTFGRKSNKKN